MTKIPFHNHNHNHKLSRRTLRRSYWSSRDTKQRRRRRKHIEVVFTKYFSFSISNSLTWFLYSTRSTIGEKAIWLSILALHRRSIMFSRTFIFPVRISLSLSNALFCCWEMKGKKWFFYLMCLLLQRKWKEREGKSDFWTFCFLFFEVDNFNFFSFFL